MFYDEMPKYVNIFRLYKHNIYNLKKFLYDRTILYNKMTKRIHLKSINYVTGSNA